MDYMLDPPEPSKDEQWLDDKVETWEEEIGDAMDLMAYDSLRDFDLSEFIDWDKVRETLYAKAEQELEEKKAEAAIARWEDQKNWSEM